ncbi:DUF1292 domain-containing protein [Fructilactobacillus fructivorans]|uniref:UPF0473 protein LF543_04605 n=2 Tax=Fructilactobacillus fructivorans TaxID=1614 RepID=A0AAE6TYG8_9LACO|nr:DUF1292 domain-containing protein [Fructilactobacillus fructivorans]KRK57864.1 hypothetical protein FC73_GL000874 [Fructilactobacillus fructivorans]KRN12592.1 hypothetical protein IV37_GL000889 [Fructilactobacillus fructivorans]KRN40742.1 hypothetical protein IV51_GL001365 [Fructilactobacillus fructivorans]QFX92865.1 DUF1292 domain-containing protein [Fructilactobacillus fructivorans]RDV65535.1 DUF1292 domain-containing protein [Fructilactobacillus fructivorans]
MSKENENNQQEQVTLVDEDGNESLYNILFTFSSDDYNRSYIFIYPATDDDNDEVDIEAYALPKDDDPANPTGGELEPIEDDNEWEMVQEMLDTFLQSGQDQK